MRNSVFTEAMIEKACDILAEREPEAYDFQEAIMRRITDLELQQMQLEGIVSVLLFMLKGKL